MRQELLMKPQGNGGGSPIKHLALCQLAKAPAVYFEVSANSVRKIVQCSPHAQDEVLVFTIEAKCVSPTEG